MFWGVQFPQSTGESVDDFMVRVVEARDISPPGCLTPEEPIDVSIYINFAGQEE
ncbi:hypothetical protein NGA_0223300, partial [Nannochloropsis gaditana CCMP526]|uniref:uncharacterized protein n=1 Tax=Nannochloropsis gaditana (strain CCMP526) TaxID=1093141 RepID=UPI00029F75FA